MVGFLCGVTVVCFPRGGGCWYLTWEDVIGLSVKNENFTGHSVHWSAQV